MGWIDTNLIVRPDLSATLSLYNDKKRWLTVSGEKVYTTARLYFCFSTINFSWFAPMDAWEEVRLKAYLGKLADWGLLKFERVEQGGVCVRYKPRKARAKVTVNVSSFFRPAQKVTVKVKNISRLDDNAFAIPLPQQFLQYATEFYRAFRPS